MSSYYHGAQEIQGEGLQTLYLMNPSYGGGGGGGGYSDGPGQANMVFLNTPMSSLNPMSFSQHQQQQHFVGIPLQPHATDPGRPPPIQAATQDLSAIHQGLSPRPPHYNLWTPTPSSSSSVRPTQQGLSLSLSPQQAPFAGASGDEAKAVGCSSLPSAAAAASTGVIGVQSVLMGSKYLKAAQQLLDEVVNVGKGEATAIKGCDVAKRSTKGDRDAEGAECEGGDSGTKKGAELTTVERQELQMKKAKLVNMLDEVEQRYRQYHHQMQIVVSSFDAVAGLGSARTYTALALQTISRQFRCLRDAISGQVRATSKSLGEEDCQLGGGSKSVGSRLRFVDHHLRQQRALQQLGMIQNSAWRPQRGLPERAVSVLRAWLFEHFLHPYPKDSDKHMLAKQTGLTRSQVSNWFINARVRLWKPMVEEMYNEEAKEQEQNNGDDKTSKSEGSDHSASRSTSHPGQSPTRTDQTDCFKPNQDHHHHHHASLPPVAFHSSNLGIFDDRNEDSFMQHGLKIKARMDEPLHHHHQHHQQQQQQANIASADDMSNRELLMKFMGHHGGGFGAYQLGELGRFDHEQFAQPGYGGNGVSLTLGLPHCETLSLSGAQQPPPPPAYLSNESIPMGRRLDMGAEESDYNFSLNNNPSSSHHPPPPPPPNAYDHSISIQNRKRFAAQLLPDYVT